MEQLQHRLVPCGTSAAVLEDVDNVYGYGGAQLHGSQLLHTWEAALA